jgi:4a-hydroxytetrahydrobiopterin dehydratase
MKEQSMITTSELLARHCKERRTALSAASIVLWLPLVPGWAVEGGKLSRLFKFPDFYKTMDFVNAVALMTHAQDHHPQLAITYNTCLVRYATHSVNQGQGGLSENDFICAAKDSAIDEGVVGAA